MRCVAKGSILTSGLESTRNELSPQSHVAKLFWIKERTEFCCEICGKRFNLTSRLESTRHELSPQFRMN